MDGGLLSSSHTYGGDPYYNGNIHPYYLRSATLSGSNLTYYNDLTRHGTFTNVLYTDGHVDGIKYSTIQASSSGWATTYKFWGVYGTHDLSEL